MATSTTRLNLRKPDPTDTVNVTTDLSNNYDIVDNEIGIPGVLTFPALPYAGKMVYRADQAKAYFYDGGGWKEIVLDSNITDPVEVSITTDLTTTSTTYANLSTDTGTTFTAPPSGGVYVNVIGRVEVTAGETIFLSYEVRENNGSGAVVSAAADDGKAVIVQDQYNMQATTRSRVTGLTAGNTYYVRFRVRVTNGTGTIFYAGLLVEPVM